MKDEVFEVFYLKPGMEEMLAPLQARERYNDEATNQSLRRIIMVDDVSQVKAASRFKIPGVRCYAVLCGAEDGEFQFKKAA